jgi:uncharacterized cupredoxin-like copper-binding protein
MVTTEAMGTNNGGARMTIVCEVLARRYRRAAPILAALGALLALAGCGSSSSSTSSVKTSATQGLSTTTPAVTTPAGSTTAARKVTLEANPTGALSYDKKALTAHAGKVIVDFTNTSPLDHNVTIESSSGKVLGATPTFTGGSKELELELPAGTYKFFCSVPGHRMAGMEGTLTVRS